MNSDRLSAAQQKIVDFVWTPFQKTLKWPLLKTILVECAHAGIDFDDAKVEGVYVSSSSPQEVHLSFERALAQPGVRDLLAPVPELLKLGAQRFLAHPTFADELERAEINQADFAWSWPDPQQMALAHALFDMAYLSLGGGSATFPGGFSYSCSIQALRYEHVQTLDEALAARPNQFVAVEESQRHAQQLRLMNSVYDYAVAHGRWPVSLPFTVENRHIGSIPRLVEGLSGTFVKGGSNYSRRDRIVLLVWALPLIDPSGERRALFVDAVKALCRLWLQSPEDTISVSLEQLSSEMGRTSMESAPAALLIQSEPWIRGGNFNSESDSWCVSIDKGVHDFRNVENWEQYVELRVKRYGQPQALQTQFQRLLGPDGRSMSVISTTTLTISREPGEASGPKPTPGTLFAWIHLSDIHMGHGGAEHHWDQALVLEALRKDIAAQRQRGVPSPDVMLVTGDIAFSGVAQQYARAKEWLREVAKAAGLGLPQVFTVPGNHDVERAADKDRNLGRLVRALRTGVDHLDDVLAHEEDRVLLARRMAHYLEAISELGERA